MIALNDVYPDSLMFSAPQLYLRGQNEMYKTVNNGMM